MTDQTNNSPAPADNRLDKQILLFGFGLLFVVAGFAGLPTLIEVLG